MSNLTEELTKKSKFDINKFTKYLAYFSIVLVICAFLFIIIFITINGVKNLSLNFIFGENTSKNPSIKVPIINTFIIILGTLVIAVPIGIFTAVALTEYFKKDSKFVSVVRTATETLAGIPSIIYALFGMVFFVKFLGWGYSLKAGICTLAIMILPTIIRSTEDSILNVPTTLREASFGLGAGKLRTVTKIVLPNASSGIISSIILSIGRIVGESAAVIFTAGTTFNKGTVGLNSQGASLAVAMYILIEKGLTEYAYSAALVLLICTIGLNVLSSLIGKKLGEKYDYNK